MLRSGIPAVEHRILMLQVLLHAGRSLGGPATTTRSPLSLPASPTTPTVPVLADVDGGGAESVTTAAELGVVRRLTIGSPVPVPPSPAL